MDGAFKSCAIKCFLRDRQSVRIECGQEESLASLEMRDRQTKLVISNDVGP